MNFRLHLNRRAQALMLAGFQEGRAVAEIAAEVSTINGSSISVRTVNRMRLDWRRKVHLKRLVREGVLAIRACEGDASAMEYLARNIELDARWKDRRKQAVSDTLGAFFRDPSPKSMAEIRHQLMLFLFEHELENYVQKIQPDEGVSAE